MKMMKNIMALALAFMFVFVGAQSADAFSDVKHDMAGYGEDFENCVGCHNDSPDAMMPPIGFEDGDVCSRNGCHVVEGNGHGPQNPGDVEKPLPYHGTHEMTDTLDDDMGENNDCIGCYVTQEGPYDWYLDMPHEGEATADQCEDCHVGTPTAPTENMDKDGDKLTHDVEAYLGYSDEVSQDTDGDGLADSDKDGDGMTDIQEVNFNAMYIPTSTMYGDSYADWGTIDPMNPDSDGDGLYDGYELSKFEYGETWVVGNPELNPVVVNTLDDGGTVDGGEFTTSEDGTVSGTIDDMDVTASAGTVTQQGTYGTVTLNGSTWTYTVNPASTLGLDVVDSFSIQYVNKDGKAMTYTAVVNATVPDSGNGVWDPITDDDNDGLTNEQELALGTDPNKADTDGDGIYDKYDTNPLVDDKVDVDPDYGYSLEENIDTDGDGIADVDDEFLTDPTNGFSGLKPSTPSDETPESPNPETGGAAGLMLSLAASTVVSAGLIVFRKKN